MSQNLRYISQTVFCVVRFHAGNKKRKFLENMKTIGVTNFLAKSFNVFPFEGEWLESFGEPEKNFTMVLYGNPGNGKTEFAVKFTKYLTNFGRVAYCSYEQGISKSLQDAFKRNKMEDESGKIIITSGGSFSDLIDLLKKNRSPQIIMIDSLDYMRLTTEQFKTLIKLFPRKAFIIICWSKNEHPKSQYAKDIEYMADIKSYVKDFVIENPRSRFGGNKPFVIWKDRHKKQHKQPSLFD